MNTSLSETEVWSRNFDTLISHNVIKIINTKLLYNNELFIYCQDDRERINKDFVITKTSRVCQSIEIDKCERYDQNEWLINSFVAKKISSKRILTKQAMINTFDRH
jgi:hypothetical protein